MTWLKIQFSLAGLMIVTLWLSLALLVWMRRDAEAVTIMPFKDAPAELKNQPWEAPLWVRHYIKDGVARPYQDLLLNRREDGTYDLRYRMEPGGEEMLSHMQYRHPPHWWGHFYRVEVWLLLLVTIVIFVRILRLRSRARARATPS